MTMTDGSMEILDDVVARAKAAGADAADAVAFESMSLSATQRMGKPERVERAESRDLGLRVLIGRRAAIVSSSDRSRAALDELVDRAVAMARAVPEDPHIGLADPGELATSWPDLDLFDADEPGPAALVDQALAAEGAALAVNGVTNSDGAEASWSCSRVGLVASNGFAGFYRATGRSVSVSVIAGDGSGMETDYDYTTAVYGAGLEDAETVGRRAGERAVRRLGARKVASAKVPIVYDPRVAGGLLRHLAGAISGPSITRGTSFLKDKLGQSVFADGIRIVDDPQIKRGLRSKPFDGEGIATTARRIVDDGRLTTWLLDLRSARQLGLSTTGHASRGTASPPGPSPTNLYLEPGEVAPEALIGEISQGFYVTQMLGMGVNQVTGDYSRGATGFWIENGEIAYPVNEVTVAGNLADMFRTLTPANNLVRRYGVDAPTLRIDGMTLAGR